MEALGTVDVLEQTEGGEHNGEKERFGERVNEHSAHEEGLRKVNEWLVHRGARHCD